MGRKTNDVKTSLTEHCYECSQMQVIHQSSLLLVHFKQKNWTYSTKFIYILKSVRTRAYEVHATALKATM